jgi:hypothetical protein
VNTNGNKNLQGCGDDIVQDNTRVLEETVPVVGIEILDTDHRLRLKFLQRLGG